MRRLLTAMFVIGWVEASNAVELPTNAVSMLESNDRRIDWWSSHYSDKRPRELCWLNQPGTNFYSNCRQVFSVQQIIEGEEVHVMDMGGGTRAEEYARNRTSLYEDPLPFAPPIVRLSAPSGKHRADLKKLTETLRKASFRQQDFWFGEMLLYQWGWNISYEKIGVNSSLEAGWDFWARAADRETLVCNKKQPISFGEMSWQCIAVVWLVTAKHVLEPKEFRRGVALCGADQKRQFYVGCSPVMMETLAGERYIKAMVGSPMAMGGGAFANDFGRFVLSCEFPNGAAPQKLRALQKSFQFGGTYNVSNEIKIDAITGFRRFEAANRFGKIKMAANHPFPVDRIRFAFYGKWSTLNIDDDKIPVFTDADVEIFRALFEATLVNVTCHKEAAEEPLLTQR